MEKGSLGVCKTGIISETVESRAKVTVNCLYKVIHHELSIGAKCVTLNDFEVINRPYNKFHETDEIQLNNKKKRKAVNGFPSHSYEMPLAVWDHTVLPATRHKGTRPALTPACKLVLDLPTPEGWKAELT